jgi:hypothetical protein
MLLDRIGGLKEWLPVIQYVRLRLLSFHARTAFGRVGLVLVKVDVEGAGQKVWDGAAEAIGRLTGPFNMLRLFGTNCFAGYRPKLALHLSVTSLSATTRRPWLNGCEVSVEQVRAI